MEYIETIEVVYNLIAGICVFSSFLCVLLMGNITLRHDNILHIKNLLVDIPVRAGLFLVSIWEFIGVLAIVFLFPPDLNIYLFIRLVFIEASLTITSAAILWIAYNIEMGNVRIINEKKEDRVV